MGFSESKGKRAIEKSNSTALNDLIDLILKDPTVDAQASVQNKVVAKKIYNVYNCSVCTFLNDKPGPECSVCTAPAPESALIPVEPVKSEQAMADELKAAAEQVAKTK